MSILPHRTPLFRAPSPAVLRRVLPALALAGLAAGSLAPPTHATATAAPAQAGTTQARSAAAQAAASFPTWGTRWVVHTTPDIDSPAVGMINQSSPGQDRVTADYQVDTGRRVCEGSACSTFMAHITQPVTGFLTVVAVDIPEDRLPGVPVQAGGRPDPQPASRQQTLQRAATWLTADNGRPVPYHQGSYWRDGYRQDCSGYASMALGLPTPGTNTVGLANRRHTRPIAMSELQPGDLVIDAIGNNNTRHVVIFEKWNDAAHRSYTAYEQRSVHGTSHRSLTYGLAAGSEYKAYRPLQYGN
ncbi:hypothetical protein H0H10_14535 [Streptomyces sp. TRM S81-3]|uniref:NlpC/P60 domain-containing protein n=1 Tax=Streptomyces griseicoloratus TaxID=2752516 RepID=A0A926L0P0_9ACTN|nr:hypothetical protein [Streptomyces griseicoloratus]MBD0420345.1 hypothetical protein [Streptomyces griseicoloratus]